MKNKKAQVNVALTIGSIVIPIIVLLGALIFSWAMISTTTDAGRIAGLVAHDMVNMIDLTYSVPDDITLRYVPVPICGFASQKYSDVDYDFIYCFNGFMNFTSEMELDVYYKNSEFPVIKDPEKKEIDTTYPLMNAIDMSVYTSGHPVPLLLMMSSGLYFPEDAISNQIDEIRKSCEDSGYMTDEMCDDLVEEFLGETTDFPIDFQFSAFANMMDFNLLKYGTTLKVDNGVFIEKRREAFSDTLTNSELAESKDPLEELVLISKVVCDTEENKTIRVLLKPGFYIKSFEDDESKLCLYKARITPNMNEIIEELSDRDNKMYYEESEIYCFNFDDIPMDCTYNLKGIKESLLQYPARPYKVGSNTDKTLTAKDIKLIEPVGGSFFIIDAVYDSGTIKFIDNTTIENRFKFVLKNTFVDQGVDLSKYKQLSQTTPLIAEILWIADIEPRILDNADIQMILDAFPNLASAGYQFQDVRNSFSIASLNLEWSKQ